jgi:hypothetical protein
MFSFTEKLTVNIPYISSEKLISTSRDSNPRLPLDSRMPEPLGYRGLKIVFEKTVFHVVMV